MPVSPRKPKVRRVRTTRSGYNMYVKTNMPKRPAGTTATSYMGTLAKQWKDLSEKQRAPYNKQAKKFHLAKAATPPPKRHHKPSAYILYAKAKHKQRPGGVSVVEYTKSTIGPGWRGLSDAEKAKWQKKAR